MPYARLTNPSSRPSLQRSSPRCKRKRKPKWHLTRAYRRARTKSSSIRSRFYRSYWGGPTAPPGKAISKPAVRWDLGAAPRTSISKPAASASAAAPGQQAISKPAAPSLPSPPSTPTYRLRDADGDASGICSRCTMYGWLYQVRATQNNSRWSA